MALAAVGLVGLYFVAEVTATAVFQGFWWVAVTRLRVHHRDDPAARPRDGPALLAAGHRVPRARRARRDEAAWFPNLWEVRIPALLGLEMTETGRDGLDADALLLVGARDARWRGWSGCSSGPVRCGGSRSPLLYVVGFGPVLCAITLDAYVKQWRGAAAVWDKTEKTGRVMG